MRILGGIGVWVLLGSLLQASPARAFDLFSRVLETVEEGNRLYAEQHFDQALDQYEHAEQDLSREPRIHFNRGDALFKLGRAREARDAYLRATGTEDPEFKKRNYYNIGNTFLSEGAFQDAISYYRRSLEIDHNFDDARFNLELALRALQQQKQQQKEGDSGNQKDDEGDQEEKQDQGDRNQDQQGSDQQQEDRQQGDQEDPSQEKDDPQDQQEEQQEKSQQEKEGQDEQAKQEGDQQEDQTGDQRQEQQRQQEGSEEKKPGEEQDQQADMKPPPDSKGHQPKEEPGRLSRAQVQDLLDAMRENEKPFQMDRFMLPEYRKKRVDKDW